ncbi:MAG: lysylphosphatidylglycerol synthase transmembrane domain-containing protein [Bryobacterales bacterium]|nr:lysylphosphatidylglycerol synthase transmembrane domain-containing protein [Bryobacterales bacterium]
MLRPSRRGWLTGLRWTVAAGLVAWLIGSGRLDLTTLAGVRWGWALAGAVVCRIVCNLVPLVRWHWLARTQQLNLTLGTAVHVGAVGYFLSILLPASVGFDGVRLLYGSRLNSGRRKKVLLSIFMDRLIGLYALIFLAVLFGGAYLRQPVLISLVVVSAGTLAAVQIARRWGPIRRRVTGVTAYRPFGGVLWRAFVLSCFGHCSGIAGIYFWFRTLNVPAPALSVCAITPLVNLLQSISLTPMGLGVTDTASEVLFAMARVEGGAEVITLNRLLALLVSLACGIAILFPVSNAGVTPAHREAACD